MKKFIILFFILPASINCQNKYIGFNYFHYQDKSVIDSLKNLVNDDFLVFQTKDSLLGERWAATFVVWQMTDKTFFRMITSDFIYAPVELKNSQIFNYKYIKLTGAENDEDISLPTTYLYTDYSDVVMYNSDKYDFFYEYDDPTNYDPKAIKEPYRAEWISIIKNELYRNIDRLKKEVTYKRPELWSMNK